MPAAVTFVPFCFNVLIVFRVSTEAKSQKLPQMTGITTLSAATRPLIDKEERAGGQSTRI